jgi:hypothetical protein
VFVIYSLVQAAITLAGDGSFSQLVLYAAGVIIVGTMGWVIRVTGRVEKAVTRLTDCIFGYTGESGLNKDVDMLRDDVDMLLERRGGNIRRREDREREIHEDLP